VPVTPALRRLRQKDHEFEVSLGYIARSCLEKQTNKNKQTNKILQLSDLL
jgi:hypothetical protein